MEEERCEVLSVSVVGWLTKRNLFAAVKPGQWTQPSTEDQTHSPPSAWKHLRERGLYNCVQCTIVHTVYNFTDGRHAILVVGKQAPSC